ncbi:hypothetical protein BAUCODRAFT_35925 [Baudoinia panamericana UAMH 10762]|uniref:tRNA (uracil-O(2)-)-methyltransferase n=1 Tax=Baudoinia panamericana (strain UAMH 10762) TaxID=717646 RepID=M2MDR1_BAUPA|nr:uncharacterized protein BAUCODRAFT_35925 [Baudoinia panamericana UAMH 10762]EMC94696.1 hypothetical protein BAUCODRAFT_35925 [Baudoinia panamericana UAMH 10762]
MSEFQSTDRTSTPSDIQIPDELWLTVLESQCTFPPDVFHDVMLNLIKNPNVTSTYLFRADILYDSGECDDDVPSTPGVAGLLRQVKAEYQPINVAVPGYRLSRTVVRQLIPRNPRLDRLLVQTCHFFQRFDEGREDSLVIYIPHVKQAGEVPFYHPTVSRLAFLHSWHVPSTTDDRCASGNVSVAYSLFPEVGLTDKLQRTALRLLQTVHKHGKGQLAGYEKRVHLDRIILQKRYQDTYSKLKTRYGRRLAEQWVEVTDPGKHVFEDLGIAAFLIELWRDMFHLPQPMHRIHCQPQSTPSDKPPFPGFVDIGCGNGVLVHVLLSEGYRGYGFDARQRKTWSIFPPSTQSELQQRVLVPDVLRSKVSTEESEAYHDGFFAEGTFIISNHADELTAWTPLLAYLNNSAFIAIPCCSHDLSGARFRAPMSTKGSKTALRRLSQEQLEPPAAADCLHGVRKVQAAESGSLKRGDADKKMPSAYSSLCSYVSSLAHDVGFMPETDVLRIPSTRNNCIVGRRRSNEEPETAENRQEKVRDIIEREMCRSAAVIGAEWVERVQRLTKRPCSGH